MALPEGDAAAQESRALLSTEVQESGATTIRVVVHHSDPDHPSSARFHYGPAFNDQMADTIAHVKGVSPGEVDLQEEAGRAVERARQEYPESDGWVVGLEAFVPSEEGDRHVARRIEG